MSREYWKKGRRTRKQWSHFLPNRCNPSWAGRLADLFARLGYSLLKFKHSAIFTVPASSVQKQIQKRRQTNAESPEELSCQEASGREPEESGINGRAFMWTKHPITLISGTVPAPLLPTTQTALDGAGAREGCSLEVQLGFLFSAWNDNIHWLYFSPLVIFLKIFFLMWTIFKRSLLNLLQYCFCLMFLFFGSRGMW